MSSDDEVFDDENAVDLDTTTTGKELSIACFSPSTSNHLDEEEDLDFTPPPVRLLPRVLSLT